jgi:hypothetical protein
MICLRLRKKKTNGKTNSIKYKIWGTKTRHITKMKLITYKRN